MAKSDATGPRFEAALANLRERFAALRSGGPVGGSMIRTYGRKPLHAHRLWPCRTRVVSEIVEQRATFYAEGRKLRPGKYRVEGEEVLMFCGEGLDECTVWRECVFLSCEESVHSFSAFESLSADASRIAKAVADGLGIRWQFIDESTARYLPTAAFWWRLIFEAAAAELPGMPLGLADNSQLEVPDRVLEVADMVEASIMLIDAAQAPTSPEATVAKDSPAKAPPSAEAIAEALIEPLVSELKRKPGGRSTRSKDADAALGRLESNMRKKAVDEAGGEAAAENLLVEQLYSKASEDLCELLKTIRCNVSARTIRRRSVKYKAWKRYRTPCPPDQREQDVGPAALSHVRPRRGDQTQEAVDAGGISKRTRGGGITRTRKTPTQRDADEAADRFALGAGVTLPPAE